MTQIDDIVFNYNLQMSEFRNELALDKALNQDELTYDEISEKEYDIDIGQWRSRINLQKN